MKKSINDMAKKTNINWAVTPFFKGLVRNNRLAGEKGFVFQTVSSLEGFHESLQARKPIVAVSDESQGAMFTDNTPHTKRVKTVFLAMPYALQNEEARARCLETMRELFRQFMTMLILEKTKLEQNCIFIDDQITFHEIDRYFYDGMACAYFQLSVSTFTDLRYNPEEWL